MKSRNKKFDAIEITSRLLNIILDMPVEQQLEFLDQLDTSDYKRSRKYPRTYLKHPWVVLVNPDKEKISYDNFIKNISRCGMFIETNKVFLVGEKITMKFQVAASQKLYKSMGEIVRFQKNGIGIKFKRQLSENGKQ